MKLISIQNSSEFVLSEQVQLLAPALLTQWGDTGGETKRQVEVLTGTLLETGGTAEVNVNNPFFHFKEKLCSVTFISLQENVNSVTCCAAW